MTAEDICNNVLRLFELEKIDEFYPEYKCKCSKERFERGIATLKNEDLDEMVQDPVTRVKCHFCNIF